MRAGGTFLGRFFRRLADFFDRGVHEDEPRTSLSLSSREDAPPAQRKPRTSLSLSSREDAPRAQRKPRTSLSLSSREDAPRAQRKPRTSLSLGSREDAPPAQRKPRTSLSRGSAREVDFITLAILFIGIVGAGTWVHGFYFIFWNGLFAAIFCAAAWLIFYSTRFRTQTRALLLAIVLLISIAAASERLLALSSFLALGAMLVRAVFLKPMDYVRHEKLSVIAVLLFCFTAYDALTLTLERVRNSLLALPDAQTMECDLQSERRICKAQAVAFAVPEFWHEGSPSNLIRDFQSIMPLKHFADSATDNTVAFAAFAMPSDRVIKGIQGFLSSQKGFIRSKGHNGQPLAPQLLMKGNDVQLYALAYQSLALPGYLAETKDATALLLVHERQSMTWLFIVDGNEIDGRDFILHRIISGFQ